MIKPGSRAASPRDKMVASRLTAAVESSAPESYGQFVRRIPHQMTDQTMPSRILNFSAGPATLPESVLLKAREALLSLDGSGIGILEHSHRGKAFLKVYHEAISLCREVGGIPEDYEILFLQGGASLQFSMLPMNFLTPDSTADYLVTGSWSEKAVKEARRCGQVHIAGSSEADSYRTLPEPAWSSNPVYAHFTSNNTIFGTQFSTEPRPPAGAFLVCDASSDIFSRQINVADYGVIYAGAQKNLGPSGVTLVIIRKDLIERGASGLPTMLSYRTHAEKESMFNTPPTFGIYIISLVLRWIRDAGGLAAIEARNQRKAAELYQYLDQSQLFRPVADASCRSLMNVCFDTGNAETDAEFISRAEAAGFSGLKGHRSVGGMRASLYNAFPPEGVAQLVEFMRDFENSSPTS